MNARRPGADGSRIRASVSHLWDAVGLPLVGGIAIVGLWWGIAVVFGIRSFFLPKPPEVVDAYLGLQDHLLTQAVITLSETAVGFVIAAVGGITIAILLSTFRFVERAVMPWLVAVNALPKVALAPLLLVWLGFGWAPKIVMAILVCFFPIVVSTMAGLASTPSDLGELAGSLSATGWQRFVKVRLPWALPQVFVGLKVTILLALIGAVVGENQNPDQGLGEVIASAGSNADTPLAFAALAMLCAMGVGLFYIVVGLERLVVPWAREIAAAK